MSDVDLVLQAGFLRMLQNPREYLTNRAVYIMPHYLSCRTISHVCTAALENFVREPWHQLSSYLASGAQCVQKGLINLKPAQIVANRIFHQAKCLFVHLKCSGYFNEYEGAWLIKAMFARLWWKQASWPARRATTICLLENKMYIVYVISVQSREFSRELSENNPAYVA